MVAKYWKRQPHIIGLDRSPFLLLCYIINTSLEQGVFPQCWKVAKCIPVFKNKGSQKEKEFYRPVSLLPATSKVIEHIVNQRILNYFEENQLFPKSQHGFRKARSTFTAVSQMHEQWIANKENTSKTWFYKSLPLYR